jgi:hypothetical protein
MLYESQVLFFDVNWRQRANPLRAKEKTKKNVAEEGRGKMNSAREVGGRKKRKNEIRKSIKVP